MLIESQHEIFWDQSVAQKENFYVGLKRQFKEPNNKIQNNDAGDDEGKGSRRILVSQWYHHMMYPKKRLEEDHSSSSGVHTANLMAGFFDIIIVAEKEQRLDQRL
jgi:hypothetical protein